MLLTHILTFIRHINKNQAGTLVLHFDALICNVSMRNVCVEFYGVYGTRKHEKRKCKTAYRNRPLTKNHVLPCARFN